MAVAPANRVDVLRRQHLIVEVATRTQEPSPWSATDSQQRRCGGAQSSGTPARPRSHSPSPLIRLRKPMDPPLTPPRRRNRGGAGRRSAASAKQPRGSRLRLADALTDAPVSHPTVHEALEWNGEESFTYVTLLKRDCQTYPGA